jgi:4-aminobutyrate aminotransferase-like enzyme
MGMLNYPVPVERKLLRGGAMHNLAIAKRRHQAISRGVAVNTQIYASKAENAEIWDVEGRRYIDFSSGISVVNTGHRLIRKSSRQ